MSNVSYYTAEGLQDLKDELHQMKTVERPKISQQIAEARDKGDLFGGLLVGDDALECELEALAQAPIQ